MRVIWSSTSIATTPDQRVTPRCDLEQLVTDWHAAPCKATFIESLPLYQAAAIAAVARTRLPALPVKPRRKVLT